MELQFARLRDIILTAILRLSSDKSGGSSRSETVGLECFHVSAGHPRHIITAVPHVALFVCLGDGLLVFSSSGSVGSALSS